MVAKGLAMMGAEISRDLKIWN